MYVLYEIRSIACKSIYIHCPEPISLIFLLFPFLFLPPSGNYSNKFPTERFQLKLIVLTFPGTTIHTPPKIPSVLKWRVGDVLYEINRKFAGGGLASKGNGHLR